MSVPAVDAVSQPLRSLARERLIDRAAAAIRDYILANGLNGDDRLPSESELSRALGVSRNVVRQAISSLETLGVVRAYHGRGIYVADVAGTDVFRQLASWLQVGDLCDAHFVEARAIFERGVFALIMERASDEEFDRLAALAEELHAIPEPREFDRQHDAFHQAMLAATGNPFLVTLGTILNRFFWSVGYSSPHVHRISHDEQRAAHGALVRLLRGRRAEDIEEAVALHLGRRAGGEAEV